MRLLDELLALVDREISALLHLEQGHVDFFHTDDEARLGALQQFVLFAQDREL